MGLAGVEPGGKESGELVQCFRPAEVALIGNAAIILTRTAFMLKNSYLGAENG